MCASNIALGFIGIILVVLGVSYASVDTNQSEFAHIELNNVGECPEVIMIIQQVDGEENYSLQAGPGETDGIDIQADVIYEYEIRFPAPNDESESVCSTSGQNEFTEDKTQIIFDTGQFVASAGSTQTFNIDSFKSN